MRCNHRGFSLIEMLVALVVFSVGLLAIAGLQTMSKQANAEDDECDQHFDKGESAMIAAHDQALLTAGTSARCRWPWSCSAAGARRGR